ncbi:hypothetical protein FQR65_LT16535 [Abscondita terminalis]|nr:hypothetical protein FQR65_LT16535 [Abscondita terminalis]
MNSAQEDRIAKWLQEELDEEVIIGDADVDEGEETALQISEHETDTEEDCDSYSETVTEDQNISSDSEDNIPLSYFQSLGCYVSRKMFDPQSSTSYQSPFPTHNSPKLPIKKDNGDGDVTKTDNEKRSQAQEMRGRRLINVQEFLKQGMCFPHQNLFSCSARHVKDTQRNQVRLCFDICPTM